MTAALTVLAIAFVIWFAAGSIANVRRGREVLRWMQAGLPVLGARTTVRWLGTTAVQLVLREPLPPFQEVTVIVFLEPRDVPWIWALARARGRRDLLILRAQLRDAPRFDLEVVERRSWSGREVLPRLPAAEWTPRGPDAEGKAILARTAAALARADALAAAAARTGVPVRRLSVRRGTPHLQLHLDLPRRDRPASALFQAVRALGEDVSH